MMIIFLAILISNPQELLSMMDFFWQLISLQERVVKYAEFSGN
jgi:hypothetical protein